MIAVGMCYAVTLAVASPAGTNSPRALAEIDGVESLLTREPEALAEKVVRSGHFRFLGIAGFTVHVPGVDSDQCVAEPSRVFVVPKTSDALMDEQMALQARAEEFAAQYNKIVRDHLVKTGVLDSYIVCVPGARAR
jgi:hypothetical protein